METKEFHEIMDKMTLDQIKDCLAYAGYLYRIKMTAEIDGGIKIRDTKMGARAKHICNDCEVFTIEQLSTHTIKEVMRWRNVGENTIKDMRLAMNQFGFDFIDHKELPF